jgi:DNA primase
MDKQRGHFYCFGCGTSISLLNFVMRTTNKTFFEAIRFIESKKENIDIVSQIENTFKKEPEFVSFDKALIKKLNENAISNARAISYYEKRKISLNSIEKFSLGYSENQDMVTIPIHSPDGKMFVGFVARSIEGKDFKNTPGLPKSKVLFNLHRVKTFNEVYVVESSFDAIRLDQCGVPAVATLGSTISNSQCEMLEKYFNNVIVIGDNDDAGKSMQQKILTKIGSRATLISLPSRFNDIGEMEDSDINILKKKIQDPLLSVIE